MKVLSDPIKIMMLDNIPVYLTYKTVKHINFTIRKDKISISAPNYYSVQEIQKIVEKDEKILRNKLNQLKEKIQHHKEESTQDVSDLKAILLFGKDYKIEFKDDIFNIKKASSRILIPEFFKDYDYSTFIFYLDEFIKTELENYISQRLQHWRKKTGLYCDKFTIRKMTSRWGSCTTQKKTIRFNFYLAMLPKTAIDAVIIHELCHLKEANHQKGFYDLLYKYDPRYESKHKIVKNTSLPIKYLL